MDCRRVASQIVKLVVSMGFVHPREVGFCDAVSTPGPNLLAYLELNMVVNLASLSIKETRANLRFKARLFGDGILELFLAERVENGFFQSIDAGVSWLAH